MDELLSRPYAMRAFVRLPSFIINTADEGRQLSAEVDGLLKRQSIAQVVQHGAKHRKRLLHVGEIAVFN
jgi:hypothetical protein